MERKNDPRSISAFLQTPAIKLIAAFPYLSGVIRFRNRNHRRRSTYSYIAIFQIEPRVPGPIPLPTPLSIPKNYSFSRNIRSHTQTNSPNSNLKHSWLGIHLTSAIFSRPDPLVTTDFFSDHNLCLPRLSNLFYNRLQKC